MLSEKEYNLIKYALDGVMINLHDDTKEIADNLLLKLSEHVTVEEVAHRHERRDLDRL
tara:strand:+ start:1157 stop:1330 length:174 start_codon:yes stop_codon:yes gene_type:complete